MYTVFVSPMWMWKIPHVWVICTCYNYGIYNNRFSERFWVGILHTYVWSEPEQENLRVLLRLCGIKGMVLSLGVQEAVGLHYIQIFC